MQTLDPQLLTIAEAAVVLNKSKRQVREYIKSKRLTAETHPHPSQNGTNGVPATEVLALKQKNNEQLRLKRLQKAARRLTEAHDP